MLSIYGMLEQEQSKYAYRPAQVGVRASDFFCTKSDSPNRRTFLKHSKYLATKVAIFYHQMLLQKLVIDTFRMKCLRNPI